MEVGAGHVAGRTDGADDLAAVDPVADGDIDRGLVAVPDLGAVIEGHHGLVAVGAVVAGLGDRAVGDGHDGVTGLAVEVQAGVIARPEAVLAEGRGDLIAGEGENPLVLLDLRCLLLGRLPHLVELGRALSHLLLREGDQLGVGLLDLGVTVGVAADHDTAASDRLSGSGAEGAGGVERGAGGKGSAADTGRSDCATGGDGQHSDTRHEGQAGQTTDQRAARRRRSASFAVDG